MSWHNVASENTSAPVHDHASEAAHQITLNLAGKLRHRAYREEYFVAESSAHIAKQLIALRKRRNLSQAEVAELIGTKQPAISRIERADYHNRSLSALQSIAKALDARVTVYIEPSEDVLGEYETSNEVATVESSGTNLIVMPAYPSAQFDLNASVGNYFVVGSSGLGATAAEVLNANSVQFGSAGLAAAALKTRNQIGFTSAFGPHAWRDIKPRNLLRWWKSKTETSETQLGQM